MGLKVNLICMEELDSGAHASYSLFYHIVWAPKYRRHVLDGKVGERAKQIIIETSAKYGYKVDTLKVSPDHIHLLVYLRPRISVVEAIRTLKSITAKTILKESPELNRYLWRGNMDTRLCGQQCRRPIPRHSETVHNDRTTLTQPKEPPGSA